MNNKFKQIVGLTAGVPEIIVYGRIDEYEDCISAKNFITELRQLEATAKKINVRINSPGGSVYEGIAIFNAIVNSPCEIDTHIDGFAGSIAAIIAVSGNKVYMSKYARMMTHKAAGGAWGGADEVRQHADEIASADATIGEILAKRTGFTIDEVKARFLNGTDVFFNAEQAKAAKLVDEIYDGNPVADNTGVTNLKKVWEIYNRAVTNTAAIKSGSVPVIDDTSEKVYYIMSDSVAFVSSTTNSLTVPNAGQTFSIPPELDKYKDWDELMDDGAAAELRKSNFTLFYVFYEDAFGFAPSYPGETIDGAKALFYHTILDQKKKKEAQRILTEEGL